MAIQKLNNMSPAISALSLNAARFKATKLPDLKEAAGVVATGAATPAANVPARPVNLLRELAQNVRDLQQATRRSPAESVTQNTRAALTAFKQNFEQFTQFIQDNPNSAGDLTSLKNRFIHQARQALNNAQERRAADNAVTSDVTVAETSDAAAKELSASAAVDIKV